MILPTRSRVRSRVARQGGPPRPWLASRAIRSEAAGEQLSERQDLCFVWSLLATVGGDGSDDASLHEGHHVASRKRLDPALRAESWRRRFDLPVAVGTRLVEGAVHQKRHCVLRLRDHEADGYATRALGLPLARPRVPLAGWVVRVVRSGRAEGWYDGGELRSGEDGTGSVAGARR